MRQELLPKTASVAGSAGDLVTFTSGYVKRLTSSGEYIIGILTADWTNDANNTYVPVTVDEYGIYIIDADTTLVQATHVGNAYDVNDQDELDLGGTSKKVLRVVGIATDGRALVGINKAWIGSGAA